MKGETCLSNLREEREDNSEWGFELMRLTRWYSSITLSSLIFVLNLMRQSLEKNGDRLHFCLFLEWTMVSSLFSWTMEIQYYSSRFVKTIKVAHLSQGLAAGTHTDTNTVSLDPRVTALQVDSVSCFLSLPILPSASACAPMPLWCITWSTVLLLSYHCTLQCLRHPKGFVMSVLAFPFFSKAQNFTPCPSVWFQCSPRALQYFLQLWFISDMVLGCCHQKGWFCSLQSHSPWHHSCQALWWVSSRE